MNVARHPSNDVSLHHLSITAVITEGPGVEIVAAELLLDLVQRFGYQGVVVDQLRLDITTRPPATP